MASSLLAVCTCLLVIQGALADMYLHNMRGSNNRLDEARRDRNNANRLFDSQNNNRGGYNVGGMYYFEGEMLPIEWTNQHSCGTEYNRCEIVIQMMCDDRLRDGATTQTIPQEPSNCANNDCNNDVRFGMHEDYDYYTNCRYRFRNRGLFIADRHLRGNTARFTRQNNDGTRRGYECPEERDHYPYWHPTPWIDLVVFTEDTARCPVYLAESENVKGRHYCWLPNDWYHSKVGGNANDRTGFIPNTMELCEALNAPDSELTRFYQGRFQAQFAVLEATVKFERQTCDQAWASCILQGIGLNSTASCVTTFNAAAITQPELDAVCNPCNVTDNSFVPHQWANCPTCIPEACAAALVPMVWANVTANGTVLTLAETMLNTTDPFTLQMVCPAGTVTDPLSTTHCTTSSCLGQTQTVEKMRAVDSCRTSLIGTSRFLTDVNKTTCLTRSVMSFSCFAESLPRAQWVQAPSHADRLRSQLSIPPPTCTSAPWSRVNHLGNGVLQPGYSNFFNMTMWPLIHNHCALRARYNITTNDYNRMNPHNAAEVNHLLNRRSGSNAAAVDLRSYYGLPLENGNLPFENSRGYLFRQNPTVQIFDFYKAIYYCDSEALEVPGNPSRCLIPNDSRGRTKAATRAFCKYPYHTKVQSGTNAVCALALGSNSTIPTQAKDDDFTLRLAINTNQFGRTFQDRSHAYQVRERSPELKDRCPNEIYAINVRGKRGNIVQVFPGVEYDFTPTMLHVSEGDCVHFQWTGSNTNPNNNDGQGQAGSDRSNVAQNEYIRGEGGRGVLDFGGKGRHGTTWTTRGMEPGTEPWIYDASPTMYDIQCNASTAFPKAHPYAWRRCTSVMCVWRKRICTPGVGCEACPNNFEADPDTGNPTETEHCRSIGCTSQARPANPTSWLAGLDPLLEDSPAYPASQIGVMDELRNGAFATSHPEHLDNVTFLGFERELLVNLAILNNVQLGGELSELDDAGTYFDHGAQVVKKQGTYFYLCTRNNNFSNRAQKGKIMVSEKKEKTDLVGGTGGTVGMSDDETFIGVSRTDSEKQNNNDFWMNVPVNCLSGATPVTMSASPVARSGISAASDFLFVGPSNLVCANPLRATQLTPTGGRRREAGLELWTRLEVVNSSAIWYKVWGADGALLKLPDAANTLFSLQLRDGATVLHSTTNYVDSEGAITGTWVGTPEAMRATVLTVENGQSWVFITVGGVEYASQIELVSPVKTGIFVRLPVSVTSSYGKVFRLPDTQAGRDCVSGARVDGCSSIRTEIQNAQVGNGQAVFTVGFSQTEPAGGHYYVGEGSNVALIVGIAVACFVIAMACVGSAVYFRKHPDKWDSFKLWGPRQYRSLRRSFASHV